jgi:hypothetical protein
LLEGGADGADAVGEGGGPGFSFGFGRFGFGGFVVEVVFGFFGGELFLGFGGLVGFEFGVLEFGSEVADQSAGFFGGTLVIEVDEFLEDLFVGESGGPAVGFEDGGVEVVVDLLEDGDESLFVDELFFGGESYRFRVRAFSTGQQARR